MKADKMLIATAYHEAGHAVASHFLGRRIGSVTIISKNESLGSCRNWKTRSFHPDYMNDARHQYLLRREIMTFLAGEVAEAVFTGRRNRRGAASDHKIIFDLVVYVTENPKGQYHYTNWLRCEIHDLLKKYWFAVKAVAKELLRRKTLKGQEVVDIICEAA